MDIVEHLPEVPAEAHFAIPQRAAEIIGMQVDGNGLKAEQVRLARHDTLVHQIPARLTFTIKPEIAKTQLKGKMPQGENAPTQAQALATAEGAAADFIKSPDVLSDIIMALEKTPENGWGADPFTLSLQSMPPRVYSVVDMCQKCKGATSNPCQSCAATGVTPCQPCQGQGMMSCNNCFGSGQVQGNDGTRTPCTRCNSSGKLTCTLCNGTRQMTCTACNGHKSIACQECAHSGYWTHVFNVTYKAHAVFELERPVIPQDVLTVIDSMGIKKLAADNDAEVFILPPMAGDGKIIIPQTAFLAIATAEFSIEGKIFQGVVVGLNGKIIEIPPVIDPFIKPGITSLLKLSKGPMAAEALVRHACKYRIIRQAISGLAHHGKKAVYHKIIKDYPVLLSDKYARAIVKYADQALLSLGEGPRTKGFAIGAIFSFVPAVLYFATPLRQTLLGSLKNEGLSRHILLADILVWVAAYVAMLFIIKFFAAKALRRALPADMTAGDKGLPSAGRQGIWALGASFAVWLVFALAAPAKPEWAISLLQIIGM